MASIPSTRSLGEAMAVELKPGLPGCAPAGGCAGSVASICLRSTTTVLGRIELKTPFYGTQRGLRASVVRSPKKRDGRNTHVDRLDVLELPEVRLPFGSQLGSL